MEALEELYEPEYGELTYALNLADLVQCFPHVNWIVERYVLRVKEEEAAAAVAVRRARSLKIQRIGIITTIIACNRTDAEQAAVPQIPHVPQYEDLNYATMLENLTQCLPDVDWIERCVLGVEVEGAEA